LYELGLKILASCALRSLHALRFWSMNHRKGRSGREDFGSASSHFAAAQGSEDEMDESF
jgi:hypothetical protein